MKGTASRGKGGPILISAASFLLSPDIPPAPLLLAHKSPCASRAIPEGVPPVPKKKGNRGIARPACPFPLSLSWVIAGGPVKKFFTICSSFFHILFLYLNPAFRQNGMGDFVLSNVKNSTCFLPFGEWRGAGNAPPFRIIFNPASIGDGL
ncbi:MAG: hypothetical protein C6P37_10100 [Caldibacillus debilis]|uniref:Uncharacterized protein n=1 Tax=Caldibacillus debilis TaxID=301148 RepID=A0A3E0K341_9BACI|nr:MAG: hypothetical protein C6W56_13570 [Caldibacillus debilis]REJ27807.1 MAG: hypothetical protein C6P37_10100 [Caldibacillus debilis]